MLKIKLFMCKLSLPVKAPIFSIYLSIFRVLYRFLSYIPSNTAPVFSGCLNIPLQRTHTLSPLGSNVYILLNLQFSYECTFL